MRLPILFFSLWLSISHATPQYSNNSAAPTAKTKNGTYYGVHVPELSQEIFRGIPFAHAPRFQLAQSLNGTWDGARPAIEPGLTCAGFGTNNLFGWAVGEDCLNVNVVRPQGIDHNAKLPVLVWIYGGGYNQGSNRDPEFNTSFLLQTSLDIGHPVIIVSINYRLSGFGFLAGAQVQAQGVTNLGLRDQWKALEWIQENIGGFGGDSKKVTIWGESAGAISIGYLGTAYGGNNRGLFERAIMASGTAFGIPLAPQSSGQTLYDSVANQTGCLYAETGSLNCLRQVPFNILNQTIFSNTGLINFYPVIDGDFLRNSPSFAFANNLIAPIDIITGCNTDEAIGLAGQAPFNTTTQISGFLQAAIGVDATEADDWVAQYPEGDPYPPYSQPMTLDWPALTAQIGIPSGSQTRKFYAIVTDFTMMAGRRFTASWWSKVSRGKNAYSFRWDVDPTRFPLVYTPGLGVGFAQHGAELSYEFRLPYFSGSPYPPLPNITSMQNVSYAMQVHWVAFAATGDPNSHGLKWIPKWPTYDKATENFVYNATLDDTLNMHIEVDDFRAQAIEWVNARWPLLNRE